jgi:hypothetical protein
MRRKNVPVLIGVELDVKGNLPQVILAGNAISFILGPAQRRKEQRRKNGDDRDDDEQFDQREAAYKPEPQWERLH